MGDSGTRNVRRMGCINKVMNGQETEYTQLCLELFSAEKGQALLWMMQSLGFQESFCAAQEVGRRLDIRLD